jgi:predicted glycosyltransferase/DNA-binding NarL/FixJ family response regulator
MTPRRVLIVEDEMVVQLHLTRIVTQLGHLVVGTAADMDEALALASAESPELVLTDIRLADGSDGVATAQALVARLGCAVVFISAYADEATIARSQAVGAAGYLVKPFTAPQVRAAIATAFANQDRRARERDQESPTRSYRDAFDSGDHESRGFGEGTRLLIYSHDTFGLGHLRRCMALIHTLSKRFPGISMLLVSGSPMVHRYAMPDGADYVKLPSLHKVGAEKYEARSLQIPGVEVLALRSNLILNAAREYQPNALLVDHSPTGGNGELLPTLDWLRERGGCTRILGLRDIVDAPETVQATWLERDIYAGLDAHYDHVAIYGNRDVFDPIVEYALPAAVAAKSTFVNYICASAIDAPPQSPAPAQEGDSRPLVFVTIGGGDGGGDAVLIPFLEMMREFADTIDFRAEVVTGPFSNATLRERVDELATGLPVVVHDFMPSTRGSMQQAELVISTAGYNTATDVLSWAKRSILIPRVLYRQEQAIRAQRLDELGLCTLLHPDDVTPASLLDTISRTRRDAPLLRARQAGLPLDGASRFADFCATLTVAVRAPCPRARQV